MREGPSSSRERAQRLPREERREQLLDVAADLVVAEGIDAVTMERVASRAGVSKGLGYAYFENRSDLLRALLERELAAHEARVATAMAGAPGFEERIAAAVHAWFDTVARRGTLLGALLQRPSRGVLDDRRRRYYARSEDFFGDMAARELGIPRAEAVAAAAILLAGLSGVLERWVAAGDSRELLERTFVRLAMGGLRALAQPDGPGP